MQYDAIVIGGGIVGLATAYQLLKQNPNLSVIVLEKENKIAQHQTGRNSGVIHSGIYYKPNSLKARNCLRGYQLLLAFCQEHQISYELCGKVIVATHEKELPMLKTIYERGIANGLHKIVQLTSEQIREKEPHVSGIAGIFVPYTGIVDYKEVAEKCAHQIIELGGEVVTSQKVIQIRQSTNSIEVITEVQNSFTGKLVINCAGLYSDKIAKLTEQNLDLQIVPFRGEYYKLVKEKEYLVKGLVYPVPDPAFPFLGVHLTRMIRGGVEAGPNAVFAFAREGYTNTIVNWKELWETLRFEGFQKIATKYWKTGLYELYRSFSKSAFTRALQKLVPEIQEKDLIKAEAGIRAQACHRTEGLLDDFYIIEKKALIHVCNAPSPAATSSLAIGETVAQMALQQLS
ncbi:MAG: L-2-hydroxyglutarate oxidase [Cytophagales bacterium]|nr:L-2-hydroxyglutarate oxidase [Cytophagales bacterium]MDW8385278.1 L-2-hydroxyglutarate oxidase [Flammeovirgaceae bacterium]